jgi:hypothetical protein
VHGKVGRTTTRIFLVVVLADKLFYNNDDTTAFCMIPSRINYKANPVKITSFKILIYPDSKHLLLAKKLSLHSGKRTYSSPYPNPSY